MPKRKAKANTKSAKSAKSAKSSKQGPQKGPQSKEAKIKTGGKKQQKRQLKEHNITGEGLTLKLYQSVWGKVVEEQTDLDVKTRELAQDRRTKAWYYCAKEECVDCLTSAHSARRFRKLVESAVDQQIMKAVEDKRTAVVVSNGEASNPNYQQIYCQLEDGYCILLHENHRCCPVRARKLWLAAFDPPSELWFGFDQVSSDVTFFDLDILSSISFPSQQQRDRDPRWRRLALQFFRYLPPELRPSNCGEWKKKEKKKEKKEKKGEEAKGLKEREWKLVECYKTWDCDTLLRHLARLYPNTVMDGKERKEHANGPMPSLRHVYGFHGSGQTDPWALIESNVDPSFSKKTQSAHLVGYGSYFCHDVKHLLQRYGYSYTLTKKEIENEAKTKSETRRSFEFGGSLTQRRKLVNLSSFIPCEEQDKNIIDEKERVVLLGCRVHAGRSKAFSETENSADLVLPPFGFQSTMLLQPQRTYLCAFGLSCVDAVYVFARTKA